MPKGTPSRLLDLPPLTDRQMSIIIGNLLGDGWLDKPRVSRWTGNLGNSCFGLEQWVDRAEYVEWVFNELKPYSRSFCVRSRPKMKKVDGKIVHDKEDRSSKVARMMTVCHPCFTELRRSWYESCDDKVVPCDLRLNDLSLTLWCVCDGYNSQKDRYFHLSTHSFSENDCRRLMGMLKDLGYTFFLVKDGSKWGMATRAGSYLGFVRDVEKCCAWRCFKYKFDLSHYNSPKRLFTVERRVKY